MVKGKEKERVRRIRGRVCLVDLEGWNEHTALTASTIRCNIYVEENTFFPLYFPPCWIGLTDERIVTQCVWIICYIANLY